ncbi:hypothetical protein [Staphylococcus succinus]|uniref:hypothetical protein n=1 Tax=Staphylococcus succinus TaxID=61015 RepID=UPI00301D32D8
MKRVLLRTFLKSVLTLLTATIVMMASLVFTSDFIHLTLIFWAIFAWSYIFWDSFFTQKKTTNNHTC